MFMMNTDSKLFSKKLMPESYPLYEAKMIHQYDHRWATYEVDGSTRNVTVEEKQDPNYEVIPRYWVAKKEVLNKIADIPSEIKKAWYTGEEHQLRKALQASDEESLRNLANADNLMKKMEQVMDDRSPEWLMGWRDIARSTDERTVIASIIPRCGAGNTINLFLGLNSKELFYGNTSSIVLDYCARQKVGGTHLNQFYMKQLPMIGCDQYGKNSRIYIEFRVKKLLATSYSMSSALSVEYHPWDEDERDIMKAELDALYARLYGLTRKELEYILDPASVMGENYPSQTFPGLMNKEISKYGEYRTRRLILEAWDKQEKEPELWS
jgi:hypothetical protein